MKAMIASFFAILMALGVVATAVPAMAAADTFVNAASRADGAG